MDLAVSFGRREGEQILRVQFVEDPLEGVPQILPEANLGAEPERRGMPMQRVAVDQPRAHPRQVTLGHSREALVEQKRDRAVEHAVADELESLVVFGREAAMRERLMQQLRMAKNVAERYRACVPSHSYLLAEAWKSSRMLALPMSGRVLLHVAVATSALPCLLSSTSEPRTESM